MEVSLEYELWSRSIEVAGKETIGSDQIGENINQSVHPGQKE